MFNGDRMLKLNRYERTLDRQFYKAMHELQRLQAVRRGDHVPAPEAVDVTISTTENEGEDLAPAPSQMSLMLKWSMSISRTNPRAPARRENFWTAPSFSDEPEPF